MENIKLSNHFTLAEFCNFSKYPDNNPTKCTAETPLCIIFTFSP